MSERFTLGVNYWPRRKAMRWWSDFDAGEVREEFDLIAELGLHVVRIFLLWDDWQPEPDRVPTQRLRDLEAVLDAAAERGLGIDVTFFTGHMSGPNWVPRWLTSRTAPLPSPRQRVVAGSLVDTSYRNMFHDDQALAAERLLLETVVGAFHDHEGVWMWNLGNEPDLFAKPASAAAGRAWVRAMRAVIREIDGVHPVTMGLHADSLLFDNGLRVPDVFAEMDRAVMHAYPMYLPLARHPLDSDLVPFSVALTSALAGGVPVLMEEWGGCTAAPGDPSGVQTFDGPDGPYEQFMASEEDLAAYVEAVLPKLVEVGATGAMAWCFADYHESLWNEPPCRDTGHERFFGLVRPDGSLKPHAETLRAFAAEQPEVRPAVRSVALDVDADAYYRDPSGQAARLYRAFLGEDA